jgi:hypothetical protein
MGVLQSRPKSISSGHRGYNTGVAVAPTTPGVIIGGEKSSVAYTATDARAVLEKEADILVVYFNSGCQACVDAKPMWKEKGLLDSDKTFFIEVNADTRVLLSHVGHIPSYDHRRRGKSVEWSTGIPKTVQITDLVSSSSPYFLCQTRWNSGDGSEGQVKQE